MTTRLAAGLVALLFLHGGSCGVMDALADHHLEDAAPDGFIGNPAGPGATQNASYHLGTFAPGENFRVGLYWKKWQTDTCQVSFAFAADPSIYLASGIESVTPNPNNAELIAAMDRSTGNSPYVTFYQHTRFNLPNGTPECPTCNKELAVWMIDGQLFDSTVEPFNITSGIPNTDEPLGWLNLTTHPFTEPGTYHLSLYRGWVQGPRDGATSCYYCGFDLEGAGSGGSGGCDSPNFPWVIEENDAAHFTVTVAEPTAWTCNDADIDGDGVVAGSDISILLGFFGQTCP